MLQLLEFLENLRQEKPLYLIQLLGKNMVLKLIPKLKVYSSGVNLFIMKKQILIYS